MLPWQSLTSDHLSSIYIGCLTGGYSSVAHKLSIGNDVISVSQTEKLEAQMAVSLALRDEASQRQLKSVWRHPGPVLPHASRNTGDHYDLALSGLCFEYHLAHIIKLYQGLD